jgi:hypothetical protein
MRGADLRKVLIIVSVGVVVISAYYLLRQIPSTATAGRLHELQQTISSLKLKQLETDEALQRYAGDADLPGFVERLYAGARKVGLDGHEVTTGLGRSYTPTRRRSRPGDLDEALKNSRLQVVLHGTFREIAEYLSEVNKIDRIKQISRLDLSPDKGRVKGVLVLDLYAVNEGALP